MQLPAAVTVDMSGVSLPFSVGDMLTTAMSFLGIYGPFILLGLSVAFAPRIWTTLRGIVGGGKKA